MGVGSLMLDCIWQTFGPLSWSRLSSVIMAYLNVTLNRVIRNIGH